MVLVKLEAKDGVLEELVERAKMLEKERTNDDTLFLEVIKNGRNLDFYFRPMNQYDGYEDVPVGFYINNGMLVALKDMVQAEGKKVDDYMIFALDENDEYIWGHERDSRGLCDSWEDVIENYPELEDENREFCVTMNYVSKETMDMSYWESDDYGHYYGKADSVYENENGVFMFKIHEFVTETSEEKIDRLGI